MSLPTTSRSPKQHVPVSHHASLKSTSHTPLHLKRRHSHEKQRSLRKQKRNEKLKRLREADTAEISSTSPDNSGESLSPMTDADSFPSEFQPHQNVASLIRGFILMDDIDASYRIMRKLRIIASMPSRSHATDRTRVIYEQFCDASFLEVLFQKMRMYADVVAKGQERTPRYGEGVAFTSSAGTTPNFASSTTSSTNGIPLNAPLQQRLPTTQTEIPLEFIYEASWFLTNLAGGESKYCTCILQEGCLPCVAHVLRTIGSRLPLKTLDQFIWMIANISMEAPQDVMQHDLHKAIELLLQMQVQDESPEDWCCSSIFDHTLWALLSMLKNITTLEEHMEFEPSIRLLVQVFLLSQDCDLLTKVCALFVEFTKRHDEAMDALLKIDSRLVPHLMQLLVTHVERLDAESRELCKVCLKLVGCLSSSSRVQHCQLVIDHIGCMNALHKLFASRDESVKKELGFTLSNILAGTCSQVDAVVHFGDDGALIRDLVQCYWTSSPDVQRECVIAVCNAWLCASDMTKRILVERLNTVPVVVNALLAQGVSSPVLLGCLDALRSILDVGACLEGFVNPYVERLEDERGDEALEMIYEKAMRSGRSGEVYDKCRGLLEEYFDHVM